MTNKVTVVPYDPQWPQLFSQIGKTFRQVLAETAQRIDHIGSTAVPGLDAKPIIDVQISVAALEPLDAYRGSLKSLGYVHRADNRERTKRYFREAPGQRRIHIHVRRAGSWGNSSPYCFEITCGRIWKMRSVMQLSNGDWRSNTDKIASVTPKRKSRSFGKS